MARVDQTYQLLVARHRIGVTPNSKRPQVESVILFRAIDGQLPQELLKQGLTPEFFTRAGEVKPIPPRGIRGCREGGDGGRFLRQLPALPRSDREDGCRC
jgi:hypothetical protein